MALPGNRAHLASAATLAVGLLVSMLLCAVLLLVLHAMAAGQGQGLCRAVLLPRLPRWLLEGGMARLQHSVGLGTYTALRLGTGACRLHARSHLATPVRGPSPFG